MKRILFLIFLFFNFYCFNQLQSTFQQVYSQFNEIPRGLLESVSWSNTRMQHLNGNQIESCNNMPKAIGIMGLFEDGKNYFRENAKLVASISGISIEQQLENPLNQIIAYANAFNYFYSNYKNQNFDEETSIYLTLNKLSEIPDSGFVNSYAIDVQIFQIMRFMNSQEFADLHNFLVKNYNLKSVFGKENYKILNSNKVLIDTNSIKNEIGNIYSISEAKSSGG
jgi:hypothetical protein